MEKPTIQAMQRLCRDTMDYISHRIVSGMSLAQVRTECEIYLMENGADSFWYWDVGAFVFRGEDTHLSVSGKHYQTSDSRLQENDIITIDLSPQKQKIWGDYARTLILEKGIIVTKIKEIQCEEWRNGLLMEDFLHEVMMDFVNENTTFEDLFFHMNALIQEKKYINLDFLGNLGHSIVTEKSQRIYIEKGNCEKLSSVAAFTFEPHISSRTAGRYGYKKENIYSFKDGKVILL